MSTKNVIVISRGANYITMYVVHEWKIQKHSLEKVADITTNL